jgi:hypothetical protein
MKIYPICFIIALLLGLCQPIYSQNLELTMRWEVEACFQPPNPPFDCYVVYVRPTVDYPDFDLGSSQITIVTELGIGLSDVFTYSMNASAWADNTAACDGSNCYIAIGTTGANDLGAISAGAEFALFGLFILPDCIDNARRLHETGMDPQDPGGGGNDFDINIFANGNEEYLGNYDNLPGVSCSTVPVNFIAFEAQKVGLKKAKLDWATASEEGNDYFAVQRGRDPYSWETIGVVPGAGHSARRNDYNFYDNNPYTGRNYYRIIQVDFDGSEKGTNIRELSFTDAPEQGEIEIYPNPSSKGLHVQFPTQALEKPTVMTIYDNTGRMIFSRDLSEGTDYEYIDYTKTNITTGAYILQIGNADTVIDRQKVIVQRTQ